MQLQSISRGAHSIHQLYAHLVFATYWRRALITAERKVALEAHLREICTKKGAELIMFNSENEHNDEPEGQEQKHGNHVHLLVRYPPTVSISELVHQLKGESSYRISLDEREQRLKNNVRVDQFRWSASYFAKSVGYTSGALTHDYVAGKKEKKKKKKKSNSLIRAATQ